MQKRDNNSLVIGTETYDHDIRVRLNSKQFKYLSTMSKTYKKTVSFLVRRLINTEIYKEENK